MGVGFHQLVLKRFGSLIRFHDKGLGGYSTFIVGVERDHFERVGTTFFFRDLEYEFPGRAVECGNLSLVEKQVGGVYFIVFVVRVHNFKFLVELTGVKFHGIHELHAFHVFMSRRFAALSIVYREVLIPFTLFFSLTGREKQERKQDVVEIRHNILCDLRFMIL